MQLIDFNSSINPISPMKLIGKLKTQISTHTSCRVEYVSAQHWGPVSYTTLMTAFPDIKKTAVCRWHKHHRPYYKQRWEFMSSWGNQQSAEWCTENNILLKVNKTKALCLLITQKWMQRHTALSASVELRWRRWTDLGSWELLSLRTYSMLAITHHPPG